MRDNKYLALAAVIAVATFAYVYIYLGRLNAQVEVVVAASLIPEFVEIKENMVRTALMPPSAVHESSVSRKEDVVGRYSLAPIFPGEPILKMKVSREDDARSYLVRLDKGQRAMFIPAPLGKGLGGAVHPRDKLDLIFVPNEQKSGVSASKVILQNVYVLDVRTDRGKSINEGERDPVFAGVLVSVTPDQAEKIAFGLEHGQIYLALGGYQSAPGTTPGADLNSLLPSRNVVPAAAEPPVGQGIFGR